MAAEKWQGQALVLESQGDVQGDSQGNMQGDAKGLLHARGQLHARPKVVSPKQPVSFWMAGLLFTALIAAGGKLLALVPGLDRVGPMACAILLAVAYRHLFGYPDLLRPGIRFSSQILLRTAIVLFGMQLNMQLVFQQGIGLLAKDLLVIVFALVVMMFLAKRLRADAQLSLLLAVGTGVCGAAAIAAVSPIVGAKEEDTAIGVGLIALTGTVFALLYTVLLPLLPMSALDYGLFAGISLHEIAHVAMAGAPAGNEALAMALLAKLGRVLLLAPLCLALLFYLKRRGKQTAGNGKKVGVPLFLLGFLLMSAIGTYLLPQPQESAWMATVSESVRQLTAFLLAMAMVGLGLNVSLRDVRQKALRPLTALAVTSVLLSLLAFRMV